ncbi:ketoacyl-ACP synthase III family protein [Micromonospora sp. NPDC023956]|uniref:ketoacyl-ACP synthase III family protein n=1 Tax=Micromonospora sp. NPDC023956 TaxID=3155722 RepID=UPI003403580B
MRNSELYVSGVGSYLPPPVRAADAVREGRYAAADHDDDELDLVLVERSASPAEMAVHAGRRALADADRADEVALLLHGASYYQGQDFWTPATYVLRELIGSGVPAYEVRAASNSAMAALELAAAYLRADPDRAAALITVADRFTLPGFDRWATDAGVVYSDGAAAAVLSARGGFARVHAITSHTDPELEELGRDVERFHDAPVPGGRPLDLRAFKRRYLKRVGFAELSRRLTSGLRRNVTATLRAAGSELSSVDCFVLPNLGRDLMQWEFLDPLDIPVERTSWDNARRIGHLGAGDQFANLAHLRRSGRLSVGDRVLMVGVGLGFSWTSALLEITATAPGAQTGVSTEGIR